MKTLSAPAVALALVAGLAPVARAQHDIIKASGLAGALAAPQPGTSPAPAGGARATIIGGEDEIMLTLHGETLISAGRSDGRTAIQHGTQGKVALSIFQTWGPEGLFVGGAYQGDFDGVGADAARRASGVNMGVAEAGMYFPAGENEVVVSGHAGVARASATNGLAKKHVRVTPAYGGSAAARLGAPAKRGTATILGSATVLQGAGVRSSGSVDINVSKNWQVGGGVRQGHLDAPVGPVSVIQPFVRVTWGSSDAE
ncbi:MAG: hypothetical protein HY553_19605 [Elusimicrobia bacterium]|nr:hypothetical protein [Elusimicrobiota bacterium]